MEKVKVSVIVPTYNRAGALPRAMKSVIEQNRNDIEIIIIDDNSSDNTPDVIRNMPDKRIKYIGRSENGGVSAARNDGIRIAKGEYIAFLDSDDIWAPGKLEAQLKILDENKNIGMVCTNANIITGGDSRLFISGHDVSHVVYGARERTSDKFPGAVMVAPPSSWMLRAGTVSEIGFFDESMKVWEDCDYFVRIAQKTDAYFLNMPLIDKYTGDSGQLSRDTLIWHEGKKLFYTKHFPSMSKDKQYLFQFYKGMGKDCLILKRWNDATGWFTKALRIKPVDLNLYWKIIRARARQN
ncbi:MAG: glycosyltransferase family 2 protein [Candidatus Omnitrophica bacterium]|nr:glycosyltransferase family 2 protein [Candidatus Omnitrophota bacterium]